MAQAESSKLGDAAVDSAVIPTRQPLSRSSGEPRLLASKTTSGVWGALAGAGWEWPCGASKSSRPGFGRGWAGWAISCVAPQTVITASARIVRRKSPPWFRVHTTLMQTGASSKQNALGFLEDGT